MSLIEQQRFRFAFTSQADMKSYLLILAYNRKKNIIKNYCSNRRRTFWDFLGHLVNEIE